MQAVGRRSPRRADPESSFPCRTNQRRNLHPAVARDSIAVRGSSQAWRPRRSRRAQSAQPARQARAAERSDRGSSNSRRLLHARAGEKISAPDSGLIVGWAEAEFCPLPGHVQILIDRLCAGCDKRKTATGRLAPRLAARVEAKGADCDNQKARRRHQAHRQSTAAGISAAVAGRKSSQRKGASGELIAARNTPQLPPHAGEQPGERRGARGEKRAGLGLRR